MFRMRIALQKLNPPVNLSTNQSLIKKAVDRAYRNKESRHEIIQAW